MLWLVGPITVDSWFMDIMVSVLKCFICLVFIEDICISIFSFQSQSSFSLTSPEYVINTVVVLKIRWAYKESHEIWRTNGNTNRNYFLISIPSNFNFLYMNFELFMGLFFIMLNYHSYMLFYYSMVHHQRGIWSLFFQQKKGDILGTSIQTRSKAHDIIRRMLASLGDPYTRFLSPDEVTGY